MSESESAASGASAPDDNRPIQACNKSCYSNNVLAHDEQSRDYDQISYALSNIFMACTGGALISLMSYPYTVGTRVSYQALGTRLDKARRARQRCFSLLRRRKKKKNEISIPRP